MLVPLFFLDVILALIALLSFRSTRINVRNPRIYFELLIAVWARLRLHITVLFVITKLGGGCRELAELTFYLLVCCLFMFLALGLGHDFTTFPALVVVASAADLVHSELGHAYWF